MGKFFREIRRLNSENNCLKNELNNKEMQTCELVEKLNEMTCNMNNMNNNDNNTEKCCNCRSGDEEKIKCTDSEHSVQQNFYSNEEDATFKKLIAELRNCLLEKEMQLESQVRENVCVL